MIVLALDTSTVEGSVAVYAFGEIAFHEKFRADRSHSSAPDRARPALHAWQKALPKPSPPANRRPARR